MKKQSLKFLTLVLIGILIYSCQKDDFINKDLEISQNDSSNLVIEYQNNEDLFFKFQSNTQNGILTSNLKIFKKQQLIIETKSKIDTKIPAYKLQVYEKIIIQSKELKRIVKNSDLLEIKPEFEIFAKKILFNQKITSSSPLVQSVFYHNSIMDVTIRSFEEKKDCECTPHPGYFVDKTPFWCQEDYFIDVAPFTEALKNSNSELEINKKDVLEFLTRQNQNQISIDKIAVFLETKESYIERIQQKFLIENSEGNQLKKTVENCTLGTDLGCCGNYSGCCWYKSLWCLEHDLVCASCSKWHCGPFCESEEWAIQ